MFEIESTAVRSRFCFILLCLNKSTITKVDVHVINNAHIKTLIMICIRALIAAQLDEKLDAKISGRSCGGLRVMSARRALALS